MNFVTFFSKLRVLGFPCVRLKKIIILTLAALNLHQSYSVILIRPYETTSLQDIQFSSSVCMKYIIFSDRFTSMPLIEYATSVWYCLNKYKILT